MNNCLYCNNPIDDAHGPAIVVHGITIQGCPRHPTSVNFTMIQGPKRSTLCQRCLKRPAEPDSPAYLCNGCEDDVHFDRDHPDEPASDNV